MYHVQVKRVMNGVFQSLKTEFDPQESYSGHIVCEILQNTIKVLSNQLGEVYGLQKTRYITSVMTN